MDLSLHHHHQNDSCIKMGIDESQSHKRVSTNHNLFEEKRKAEAESCRGPPAYPPNA